MAVRSRLRRTTAAALAVLATVGVVCVVGDPSAAATAEPAGSAADSAVLTLITGDSLRHDRDATGADAFLPHVVRPGVQLYVHNRGRDWYVVPGDVRPLVAAGVLDAELFNVTYLAAHGLTDRVPVILDYSPGAGPAAAGALGRAAAVPALTATRPLPSVGAVAAELDPAAGGWAALRGDVRSTGLGAGVERVLLDRAVSVTLEHSVPRVRAPEAWQAGLDGAGTRVAVLDTGADPTHPDLAGTIVASASFVPGETADTDGHGHGTHVAATIAGTGAASGGPRKGVAPGARLLVGKVLSSTGSGQLSGVVAGMEWAAGPADADIVSMSLGASTTTPTDLLTEAVDALSASTGALFVVAAGNSGPDAGTIGTPGTAASALTVGAVDRDDLTADFSSRGPRVADGGLKPEIVAPGVGIVAARAAGTGMGRPVDDRYTAADGTSMATPHVAGAAAILAQRHPDWTNARLKAALVASAESTGRPAFEQGAGRLDVARAVTQPVLATPATADFGLLPYPQSGVRTTTLTYTNTGGEDVVLDLAASLTGPGGPAPAGLLTLSADEVTVPAGGTAEVIATVHTELGAAGAYSGTIVATGDAVRVVTPVGLVKQGDQRELTVTVRGFDGAPQDDVLVEVLPVGENLGYPHMLVTNTEGRASVTVPRGRYSVAMMAIADRPDEHFSRAQVALVDPEVDVSDDADMVFDYREAEPVRIRTPEPTHVSHAMLGYRRTPERGLSYYRFTTWESRYTLYASPTEQVTQGDFYLTYRPMLTRDQLDLAVGGTAFHPWYAVDFGGGSGSWAPVLKMLTGTRRAELVYGGGGSVAELAGRDVRGRVVVLQVATTDSALRPVVERLAAQGAAAVVLFDRAGVTEAMTAHRGDLLPVAYLDRPEGLRLLGLLPNGRRQVSVTGTPDSPISYNLSYYWHTVPADPVLTVRPTDLATVRTAYHASSPAVYRQDFYTALPGEDVPVMPFPRRFRAPVERVDYYGPVSDQVRWRRSVYPSETDLSLIWTAWDTFARPAHRRETWGAQPQLLGQAAVPGLLDFRSAQAYYLASRQGDVLHVKPQVVDGEGPGHSGGVYAPATVQLLRDGQEVVPRAAGTFDLPAERRTYELRVGYQRAGTPPGAYRVDTTWTFASGRTTEDGVEPGYVCGSGASSPAQPCGPQPLILLDYDLPLALDNTAAGPGVLPVTVRASHVPGARAGRITDLRVYASGDEGAHWSRVVAFRAPDGSVVALVPHRSAAGTVSLKVEARDSVGGTVTQVLRNVYHLRGRR